MLGRSLNNPIQTPLTKDNEIDPKKYVGMFRLALDRVQEEVTHQTYLKLSKNYLKLMEN